MGESKLSILVKLPYYLFPKQLVAVCCSCFFLSNDILYISKLDGSFMSCNSFYYYPITKNREKVSEKGTLQLNRHFLSAAEQLRNSWKAKTTARPLCLHIHKHMRLARHEAIFCGCSFGHCILEHFVIDAADTNNLLQGVASLFKYGLLRAELV